MSKMSLPQNIRSTAADTRLSGALSTENCRQTIRMLRGRDEAITEVELAEGLIASDSAANATGSSTMDALQIRLRHLHLPKLADNGLVDWDRETQTVSPTDHPIYDVQHHDDHVSADDWDSIAPVLADSRRRKILAFVKSDDGEVTRADLAYELASLEVDGEPTESLVENVSVRLHHCHLPKLRDAGLLEYNRADGTITYQGRPT